MDKVKEYMDSKKGVATIMAARELGVSERDVLRAIPEQAFEVSISKFDQIMDEVSTWGQMTIIVTNGSVIFEVKSSFPKGSYARGFYNLHEEGNPVGGHLMADNFDSIYFMDRPFMGKESLSIQIYDKKGDAAIKLYLGRGEDGEIKPEQKEKYLDLRARLK